MNDMATTEDDLPEMALNKLFMQALPPNIKPEFKHSEFWDNRLSSSYIFVKIDSHDCHLPGGHNLSEIFLATAKKGHLGLALATLDVERPRVPTASCRSISIARAVAERGVNILSPFTGCVERSYDSLGIDWYLH